MSHSRRRLLRNGVLFGSIGFAGCLTDDGEDPSTEGDVGDNSNDMPTEIRFWLVEVSVSESKQESITPIVFSNLSDGQQDIVQTALEEGEYTSEIGEESPALDDLRQRISERTDGGVEVYLKRDDTYYSVGYVSGTHIIANPDE